MGIAHYRHNAAVLRTADVIGRRRWRGRAPAARPTAYHPGVTLDDASTLELASSPADARAPARTRLALEMVAIFAFGPLLCFLPWLHMRPIGLLLVVMVFAIVVLRRDRSFDRRLLWNAPAARKQIGGILLVLAPAGAALTALTAWLLPERFLAFPREAPLVWAIVMLLYPLLSVYPQELIWRAFFFHRYRPILGDGGTMLLGSALAFAWMHVIFQNWVAVVLTLPGGWLFAYRYRASRSLLAASIEHALWGQLIFTIGLGWYFYHGAARVAP